MFETGCVLIFSVKEFSEVFFFSLPFLMRHSITQNRPALRPNYSITITSQHNCVYDALLRDKMKLNTVLCGHIVLQGTYKHLKRAAFMLTVRSHF